MSEHIVHTKKILPIFNHFNDQKSLNMVPLRYVR